MELAKWWADDIQPDLSQGDVVINLPVFESNYPPKYLKRHNTLKGGGSTWVESESRHDDKDGRSNFLATGRHVGVIVVSHSCELDKGKKRVIVAPFYSIDTISEEQRNGILAQKFFALMPLPDVPDVGTCYADFRSITALHRRTVDEAKRVASMTETAHERLGAQIVAFFLRKG